MHEGEAAMAKGRFGSRVGRVVLVAGALMLFAAGYWVSARQAKPVEPPQAARPGRDGKTVWVDIGGLNRKNGAADKMTKLHQEMAKQGYTCIGIDVYTENGDLEGFFCSYVKEP